MQFQGLTKMAAFLTHKKKIVANVYFMQHVYKMNTKPISDNYETLKKTANIVFVIHRIIVILFILTAMAFALTPVVIYLIEGGPLIPILPCFFPFIDETTTWGYTFTALFHLFLLYLSCVGLSGSDLTIISMALQGLALADVFDNSFRRLNEMIKVGSGTPTDVKFTLRNLVKMHIDICRSVTNFEYFV